MFYYRAAYQNFTHSRRPLAPGMTLVTRNRPRFPIPVHLSPNGRATLCGLPTADLVLIVSDPVQYLTTDVRCQKCLRSFNALQPAARPAARPQDTRPHAQSHNL